MAGWREIREAFTASLVAIDPRIEPDLRWSAYDRAQPPATAVTDRAFAWMLPPEGMPRPDPEFASCCCTDMIAQVQLWVRYKVRADRNITQDMIADDLAQVASVLLHGTWPSHIYEVDLPEGHQTEEITAVSPASEIIQPPRVLGILLKIPVLIKYETE
jgi:hypothetical protein